MKKQKPIKISSETIREHSKKRIGVFPTRVEVPDNRKQKTIAKDFKKLGLA